MADRGHLATERSNPRTRDLDQLDALAAVNPTSGAGVGTVTTTGVGDGVNPHAWDSLVAPHLKPPLSGCDVIERARVWLLN